MLAPTTSLNTILFDAQLRHNEYTLTCLAWLRGTEETTTLPRIRTRLLCAPKQPATLLVCVRAPEKPTRGLLRRRPKEPSPRVSSLRVRVRGPKESSRVRCWLICGPKERAAGRGCGVRGGSKSSKETSRLARLLLLLLLLLRLLSKRAKCRHDWREGEISEQE